MRILENFKQIEGYELAQFWQPLKRLQSLNVNDFSVMTEIINNLRKYKDLNEIPNMKDQLMQLKTFGYLRISEV